MIDWSWEVADPCKKSCTHKYGMDFGGVSYKLRPLQIIQILHVNKEFSLYIYWYNHISSWSHSQEIKFGHLEWLIISMLHNGNRKYWKFNIFAIIVHVEPNDFLHGYRN